MGGKNIKALVQVTKQAFAYVFDRVTGQPVWPIEEKPVPASDVPGERASPTQPFPTKPAPYDRQGITVDDLIDLTPELNAQALEIVTEYGLGPLFTPAPIAGANGKRDRRRTVHCGGRWSARRSRRIGGADTALKRSD